jgi:hypothetical protein
VSGTDSGTDVPAVLAAIHEGLADDGVYIDPTLATTVTPDELAAIVDNLQASPVPTFLIVYPFTDGDDFSANPQDLVARLHATYPEPGHYLATSEYLQYGGPGDAGVSFIGRTYDVPGQSNGEMYSDAFYAVSGEDLASVGAGAERLTALLLSPDEATKAYEKVQDARCAADPDTCSTSSGSGRDGGSDGGPGGSGGVGFGATGLVIALVVAVVLATVGWVALRRRVGPSGSSTGRGPTFALPPSAMERIREAHDRKLEKEADDELLALGEAVDATEIGKRHDRDAWQAALDHYDAARRALDLSDRSDDVLDLIGALVLARRGRAAFATAVKGRRWVPPESCYLNPLHGNASGRARLRSTDADDVSQEVPVCTACQAALKAGDPPDILDVVHHGKPRHYFETDVEPWASTGFGSLDRDLVAAFQRTRR